MMKLKYRIDEDTGYLYTDNNEHLSAVARFRNQTGNVLGLERYVNLVNRDFSTMIMMPGGKAEYSDIVHGDVMQTLINTCTRESFEETGYTIEDLIFFDFYRICYDSRTYLIACFDVISYEGNLHTFPTDEHIAGYWHSEDFLLQPNSKRGAVSKQIIEEMRFLTSK